MLEICPYDCELFRDSQNRVLELKEDLADLRSTINKAMPILDNLLYWETCPNEYKEKIIEIQKIYNP